MEQNAFICNFCNKTFSVKSSLVLHKKTAKYCLAIQGKINNNFKCDNCNQTFTTNNNLRDHLKTQKCKKIQETIMYEKDEKDEKVISILTKQIEFLERELMNEKERAKKLQEIVSSIAINNSKPNNTNIINNSNNTGNGSSNGNCSGNGSGNITNKNYLNLNNVDNMTKFLDENLSKDVVGGGQKALARLISDKYLRTEDGSVLYKCTDHSRQTFEFVNENGNIEKDVKASKLKSILIKGHVSNRASEIGPLLWTREDGSHDPDRQGYYILKVSEIVNIANDDSKFRSELSTNLS